MTNLILYKNLNIPLSNNHNNIFIKYNYFNDDYNSILNKVNIYNNIQNIFIISDLTIDNFFKLTFNCNKVYYNNINNKWHEFFNFINILKQKTNNIFIYVSYYVQQFYKLENFLNNNETNIKFINNHNIINYIDTNFNINHIFNTYKKYSLTNIVNIEQNNGLLLNNTKTTLLPNNNIIIEPDNVYKKYKVEKYNYKYICHNNYSFCGIETNNNLLVTWGDKLYGGNCTYNSNNIINIIPTPLFFIGINQNNQYIVWGNLNKIFNNVNYYFNIGTWNILNANEKFYFFENDYTEKQIIVKNNYNTFISDLLLFILLNKNLIIQYIKLVIKQKIYAKLKLMISLSS